MHLHASVLSGQVINTIGLHADRELGQFITADADGSRSLIIGLVLRLAVQLDEVCTQALVLRDGPVRVGHTETRRRQFASVFHRSVRSGHRQRYFGRGERATRTVAHQRAHVHHLPRLIERLVGGDKNVGSSRVKVLLRFLLVAPQPALKLQFHIAVPVGARNIDVQGGETPGVRRGLENSWRQFNRMRCSSVSAMPV